MRRNIGFLLAGLLVALLLAGVVSNYASASPDGLDSAAIKGCAVTEDEEIIGGSCMALNARDHELAGSPFADYGSSVLGGAFLGTATAGVVGVLLTFVVAGGLFWLARGRGEDSPE